MERVRSETLLLESLLDAQHVTPISGVVVDYLPWRARTVLEGTWSSAVGVSVAAAAPT